ncbi:MAG: outer membrane lipoprotein-sorting protein, partial [Spirochaetaceae bacterium]|nr:outer membrane lipoprotein-sorting protein [Spirochaetaceae bacterium]
FMMRREYFDFNSDLLKIYQVEDFLEIDSYIYPVKISMENVQSGHRSLLLVTDVSTEDIPDRFFTTRYLQNN